MISMTKRLVAVAFLALFPGGLAAEQVDVTFESQDGLEIAGSWRTPKSDDNDPESPGPRWPAVVLVQGSGPTDRNGNQLPRLETNLLSRLARLLAENGIASLRFDKRGMYANAAQRPSDVADFGSFFSWDGFVGDVAAALDHVAGREDVDPARIALIGHSQGGTYGLAALERTSADVKLLALLASPARPIGDVIRDQLETQLADHGVDDAASARLLEEDAAIRAALLENGQMPEEVSVGLRALYPAYAGPLYQSWLRFDPLRAVQNLRRPVLVIIGRADLQVSAEKDGALFEAVLEDRTDGSRFFFPEGVSHHLKRVEGKKNGVSGAIDSRVRATLVGWVGERL